MPKTTKDMVTARSQRRFKGSTNDWDAEITPKPLASIAPDVAEYETHRVHGEQSSQNTDQLAELKQLSEEGVREFRFKDQDILEDEAPRIGRRMDHEEFIRILRAGGVRCWYNTDPFKGIIGLRAIRRGYEQLGLQFICGVKLGRTTEYDTFHYDSKGLPLNKKTIGWRSVLLVLIAKGIISEQHAHKMFGDPVGSGSVLYKEKLHEIRNARAQGGQ